MASTKEYLDFILEQLSGLDEISYKAMMGEYIIYFRGKIVGGIYDDRFLVKNVKTAREMMPDAEDVFKYRAKEDAVYEQYRNVQEVFYKGIFDGTEFL